jgi:hypothetical protein
MSEYPLGPSGYGRAFFNRRRIQYQTGRAAQKEERAKVVQPEAPNMR